MQVAEADVARIPRTNLRVPVAEFVRVWTAAEERNDANTQAGRHDWHNAAVVVTCRWLARAMVRPSTGASPYPALSPVTKRSSQAYEELIEAETVAADKLDVQRPEYLSYRHGWTEGICVTLHWAWLGEANPPLPVG